MKKTTPELTDKGIDLLTGTTEDPHFCATDVGAELSEVEAMGLQGRRKTGEKR